MKRIILLFAFLIVPIHVCFASVQGEFKINGKPAIVPKHAAAYAVRDGFNPRQWQVEIVLSEGQADANAAADALDPHTNLINQQPVRAANYILLWVDPDGKVSMNATLTEGMQQYVDSTNDGLKAELTTNTKDRVAGRVTSNPVKTMSGETYQIDVTFDTTVARKAGGSKLQAGGGEPGKGFQALYAAREKKDLKGILANSSERLHKTFVEDYRTEEENLSSAVDMLMWWLPKKNMKITGGELYGDSALLEVEGELNEGLNGLYIIRMIKSPAGWVFDEAATVGMLR